MLVPIEDSSLWLPMFFYGYEGAAVATIDAVNEAQAQIVHITRPGSITDVILQISTNTLVGTTKIAIQALSSGVPSGVDLASYVGVLSTGQNTYALSTPLTVAAGDVYAIVVQCTAYTSGTLTISGSSYLAPAINNWCSMNYLSPGYAWAASANQLNITVKYADGYIPCGYGMNFGGADTANLSSSTTPDEVGNLIILPFECMISAIFNCGDFDSDISMNLYIYGDKLSRTHYAAARVSNARAFTVSPLTRQVHYTPFTEMRVTTEFLDTTTNVHRRHNVLVNSDPPIGAGGKCLMTSRADAGAWTDDATRYSYAGVVLSAIDDGLSKWRHR